MSGIEVAGIVLAIIPILTAALGKIDETPDRIARFRTWQRDIPTFIAQLNAQRIRLVMSLRILFQLAGLPEPNLQDISQKSAATLWDRADIVVTLKQAHGEVYDAIESDIKQIRGLMEELCAKFGLSKVVGTGDLTVSWTQRARTSRSGFISERLFYSQSGKEVKDLLLQIDSRQQSIRGTLGDIESLKTRPRPPPRSVHVRSQTVRQDALKLHDVLEQVLRCKLRHAHNVRLQLDHEAFYANLPPQQQAPSCFRLGISSANSTAIKFAEIHVLQDNTSLKIPPMIGTSPQSISDICSVIERHCVGHSCLGFQIESPGGTTPKLMGVFEPRACQAQTPSGPCLSLYQLLQQPPHWKGEPLKLNQRDRRFLATRIALYALQLQCSPWASQRWGNEDILIMSGDWNGSGNPLELNRPFVSKEFDSSSQPAIAAGSVLQGRNSSRQFFLALATLIMEICLGEIIKYTASAGSYQQGLAPEYEKLLALQKWRDKNEGNLSDAYQKAIAFCLASALNPNFNLESDGNTDLAIEAVVVPLVKEYEIFTGISPTGGAIAIRA